MARIKGPNTVQRYSAEFKLKAVKLSSLTGVMVQDVAEALGIHPFMLSRWRKEAREGRLRGRGNVTLREVRDIRKLSGIERAYALLKSPRIHFSLQAAGFKVGRKRVARLMRKWLLKARSARIYRRTPGTRRFFGSIPNRVLEVKTTAPGQLWVGDVTYLKSAGRWRYLAVVLDRHSRRVLSWSLGETPDVKLTLLALNRALRRRRPQPGLIFHSDAGWNTRLTPSEPASLPSETTRA